MNLSTNHNHVNKPGKPRSGEQSLARPCRDCVKLELLIHGLARFVFVRVIS
jgi:hypothetical protein